jgi:hypothetical protein
MLFIFDKCKKFDMTIVTFIFSLEFYFVYLLSAVLYSQDIWAMQSSLLHYIFHSFYKTFNNHAIASPNSVLKIVMEEQIF